MEQGPRRRVEALDAVAGRARPVALAGDHVLPTSPALAPLLPDAGLRRGTVVAVDGALAATSLAMAVAAGPSAAGSWVVLVGHDSVGVLAAGELGVRLERLALVASPPPPAWGTVVAALLEAVDVVVVRPPARVRTADARRLVARARERGSVLVLAGPGGWADGVDVRLTVTASHWEGLEHGHGHLRARRVEVRAEGRRAAARRRRATLWLPDAEGGVRLAADAPAVREAPTAGALREVG